MRALNHRYHAALALWMVALMTVGCTASSPPGELGLIDTSTTTTLPPVTTVPIVTTAPPRAPTTSEALPEPTFEEAEPDNLDVIYDSLRELLGPTDNITEVFGSLTTSPQGLPTPPGSEVVEVSIGAGATDAIGEAVAQVSISLTTTAESSAVFTQITNGLVSSGLVMLDTYERGSVQSTTFGAPGEQLFDEFVITSSALGAGSLVRLTSNSSGGPSHLSTYLNWSAEPLPLPPTDDTRTLVVMTQSGSGRLSRTTLSVQSTAIVDPSSPQVEANRLVRAVVDDDVFGFEGDPAIDQPLTGSFTSDDFDSLTYAVTESSRIEIDENDEPRDNDVVEITLRGVRRG
ncbi:MAG: hypothetical protein HKN24_09450 [Acidimicrobiales bacterium]|nr:hypothetical protein [Acidimicrobiales bacterium]